MVKVSQHSIRTVPKFIKTLQEAPFDSFIRLKISSVTNLKALNDRRRKNTKMQFVFPLHGVAVIKPRIFSKDFVFNVLGIENHNVIKFIRSSIVS